MLNKQRYSLSRRFLNVGILMKQVGKPAIAKNTQNVNKRHIFPLIVDCN